VQPVTVYVVNRVHRFGGRILMVTVIVQLISTFASHGVGKLILMIFATLLPFLLFYIWKFRSMSTNSMGNVSMVDPL